MQITSVNNPNIKHAIKLKNAKYIEQFNECLVESEKVVNDLISQGHVFTMLFVVKNKEKNFLDRVSCPIHIIPQQTAKLLSSTATTSGVFGILQIRDLQLRSLSGSFLVLDRVQDPTNLGAIIRSAVAFGYKQIFTIDCVHPFNPKSIRASMGHVFNVSYMDISEDELLHKISKEKLFIVSADMDGVPARQGLIQEKSFGIVLGNEGQGISDKLRKASRKVVSIPMSHEVESLNVSVSAGILMFLLKN